MRKIMSILAVAMAFVACQDKVEGVGGDAEQSRLVEPTVMEQLVSDLQSGVFAAVDVEVYSGDKCIKAFGQLEFGTLLAKGSDYCVAQPMIFLKDGECRMGYMAGLYSQCENADDHAYLYHTMSWSYDIAASELTIHSKELSKGVYSETLKVLEYKDGNLILEGALPMHFCQPGCTFKYKCHLSTLSEAREEFNAKYLDENSYPCCKQ